MVHPLAPACKSRAKPENNLGDRMYTLDAFPTADNPGNTYRYHWIEREGEWPFFSYWIVYMAITVP